ncbi:unnamed protein product (mitochondrion) [Plasmodiophora brassicae]|uniref:Uncharacterized protein n=1 Tax=Plasmodiophora brassicae TaxID=37360 RepID=A0A3P3Y6S8_PLABS|nr:unnamed protein product [Plasmodiophora brassicae]
MLFVISFNNSLSMVDLYHFVNMRFLHPHEETLLSPLSSRITPGRYVALSSNPSIMDRRISIFTFNHFVTPGTNYVLKPRFNSVPADATVAPGRHASPS